MVRAALFALALLADSSGFLALPVAGGVHPLLFIALGLCYSLPRGAFYAGTWGFAGGLALSFLLGTESAGILTLAGLSGIAVPVLARPLVFWRRWTGQVTLGFLGVVLYNLVLLAAGSLRGAAGPVSGPAFFRIFVDAGLTAVVTPLLFGLVRPLGGRDKGGEGF